MYIAHLNINGHGNYVFIYTVYDGFKSFFSVFLQSFFPPAAAQEAADDCPAEGGEGQQDDQQGTNHI